MTPTKDSDLWKGVQTNNRGPTYNVNSKEDMDNLLDMLEVYTKNLIFKRLI